MKKKMSKMMVCVCVLTGLLFGCAGSQRLSDNFDEAEVKAGSFPAAEQTYAKSDCSDEFLARLDADY